MPLCPACEQPATKRNGLDRRGRQTYACRPCGRTFTANSASAFSGYAVQPTGAGLLAERDIDISHRTVLDWVQAFAPQLAEEVRRGRRPVGKRWFVDEVFLFPKGQKRYLCRAIERTGVVPNQVVTDHHQPYIKAVATTGPGASPDPDGFHRARGETTKTVGRSHVPTRDRLRNSRA